MSKLNKNIKINSVGMNFSISRDYKIDDNLKLTLSTSIFLYECEDNKFGADIEETELTKITYANKIFNDYNEIKKVIESIYLLTNININEKVKEINMRNESESDKLEKYFCDKYNKILTM